ncbi:MAG: chorismate synthase [Fidelibacterota bacterium]
MNLNKLKLLTAGESHGPGLLGILEGLPADIPISEDDIAHQLKRRQAGYGRGGRMKIETDRARIYCGVRYGRTLGSPVGLILPNKDAANWTETMAVAATAHEADPVTLPRPGHADLAGMEKYGFRDIRNVIERSSARETAMRVALGTLCRRLLEEIGITIGSRVTQIHKACDNTPVPPDLSLVDLNEKTDASPVRALNASAGEAMVAVIQAAQRRGDSVGGIFEIMARGLPYGLGSHVDWGRKLHGRIAQAIMSINAFKGIEFGTGFAQAGQYGSEVHDSIGYANEKYTRESNHAGGIEGGMSNAQPLVIRVVMKPIPTLSKPLASVDIQTKEEKPAFKERTDSCAVPAASVIGEHMLGIVLADAVLEKFGGDSLTQLRAHMEATAKY